MGFFCGNHWNLCITVACLCFSNWDHYAFLCQRLIMHTEKSLNFICVDNMYLLAERKYWFTEMQIFHRNVLITITLPLRKIFSSPKDEGKKDKSSDYDSLPVRRKSEIPLASQLILSYENVINVLCGIIKVVWFANSIPSNEPVENGLRLVLQKAADYAQIRCVLSLSIISLSLFGPKTLRLFGSSRKN